jgi:XRE family transcriptional regulator, regulator of sulfur utilization
LKKTNKNIYIGIGLRMLRKEKDLSQEEIALRSNLNTKYIGELELNKKSPSFSTIYLIAEALEMDSVHFHKEIAPKVIWK